MSKVRGYNFSRPFMGERVPQHVQNIVIREYCERNQLQYLLSSSEYAMENCHLVLMQVLNELNLIDGIVAYSLFQLPENINQRKLIYSKINDQNKSMHFAVENMRASSIEDFDRIEILWLVRQTLV